MVDWEGRLNLEEKAAIARVCSGKATERVAAKITAREALDYACDKLFAKHSVVESSRLLTEAMRYSVGQLTPEEVRATFNRRGMVEREIKSERLCTSLDVLSEEVSLINFVRQAGAWALRLQHATGSSPIAGSRRNSGRRGAPYSI